MKGDGIADPAVAAYARAHTTPAPEAVAAIAAETRAATPSPGMMSGLVEERVLEALVVATRARRVLEVGTFTGGGTLAMAARLPADGVVITIERDEEVAAIARRHIEASPHRAKVRMVIGDAREAIDGIEGPFDLVFVDAWKPHYTHYYEAVLPKLAPHGIIVADNVLWQGRVASDEHADEDTLGLRAFNDHVQADPRVRNVLLTAGDGLLLIWRVPRRPRREAGAANEARRF